MVLLTDEEGQDKVTLIDDNDVTPEEPVDTQLHTLRISLHTLYGTASSISTFTLQVQIDTRTATALVDLGSNISFIDLKFAVKAKWLISRAPKVQIAAADGKMYSESASLASPYAIQQHHFNSDFRLFDVQI